MVSNPSKTPPSPSARDRLVASALALFNERGYAATTVREIVEAAGVTKPVLYYYFRNKEGLFLFLMENAFSTFGSTLAQAMAYQGTASARIEHLLLALYRLSRDNTAILRLIHALFYGPPQGAPFFDFEKFHQGMLDAIRRIIREGVASREFRPFDLETMALLVLGILDMNIEIQLCHPELDTGPEDLSRMLKIVFTGLQRPKPGSKRSSR